MKKLLLLLTIFIFACSSDEENTNNQNTEQNTKLLKTFTTIDSYCGEGSDTEYFYDLDGRLIEEISTYWQSDCDAQNWDEWTYDEPYSTIYNYTDDSIQVSDETGLVEEIFLNPDGTASTSTVYSDNFTFNNGYLVEALDNDDNDYVLFDWENGNLKEVHFDYGWNNTIINKSYTYEYSQYTNHTPLFNGWQKFLSYTYSLDYQILGVFGKNSDKLPSTWIKITYSNDGNFDEKRSKTYSYIFDADGYPTRITEIETFYDYDDQIEDWVEDYTRQTIVELTYYE